jgi:hypothetical protein
LCVFQASKYETKWTIRTKCVYMKGIIKRGTADEKL